MNLSSVLLFRILLGVSVLCSFVAPANAESEEETYRDYPEWDWDLFDGEGWTPRYAYLDNDNVIGYAHYAGLAYYHKRGAEQSGAVFRYAHGTKGEKYNVAYSNAFSFMSVDFGFSYHVLDDDNPRDLEDLELLGLEMGLRFWVVQIIATHTEDYSWATLAYGF
jgi:hypothetical protein